MSTLLKTLGYITGALTVSYLTLTTMMQDPHKSYRGHLKYQLKITIKILLRCYH